MKAKIYVLKDPYNFTVKYVGCTTNSLPLRLSQHIYDSNNICNKKADWIFNLKEIPLIELIEEVDFNDWKEKEKYYIDKFSKNNLVNSKKGGSGIILNRSLESIRRSADSKKIEIYQFNINGTLIKKWKSSQDACKELNISRTGIYNCLNNLSKSSGGFMWSYNNKIENFYIDSRKRKIVRIENNKKYIFNTIKEASIYYNINHRNISNYCKKKTNNFSYY